MEGALLLDGKEVGVPNQAATAAIYHLRSGGRRIRARLALHASLSLRLTSADALVLATTVEFLHQASLVHDDLQDDEILRHGVPTVAAAYGANVAICTGDLLVSCAYATLAGFSNSSLVPQLITLVHAATEAAIRGQCAGFPRTSDALLDLPHYRQVAIDKSGALLRLPLQLAFLCAGKASYLPQAQQAAEEFAVGYQIMDDLQDVEADGPMAMNVVAVLKCAGHGDGVEAYAHQLGVHHLKRAADLAEQLPNGAGELLKNLAQSLTQKAAK